MSWWRSVLCFKHEAIEVCENEETTKTSHQIRIFSITSSEKTKKYKMPRKDRKGTLRLMKHLEQRSRDFWDDSDLQPPAGYSKTHDRQRKQRLLELGHVCFLKQKAYQHYLAVQKAAKMDIKGEGIMSATMGRMLLRDAREKASKAMCEYVSAHEMYGLYLRGIVLEYVQSR